MKGVTRPVLNWPDQLGAGEAPGPGDAPQEPVRGVAKCGGDKTGSW
jgi:hypothetical protein